jgi:hypothetical protein
MVITNQFPVSHRPTDIPHQIRITEECASRERRYSSLVTAGPPTVLQAVQLDGTGLIWSYRTFHTLPFESMHDNCMTRCSTGGPPSNNVLRRTCRASKHPLRTGQRQLAVGAMLLDTHVRQFDPGAYPR